MNGLKIWILLSLMTLLASCIPQTKHTACSPEEAFNATLRTCVPVVPGVAAFVNISDFNPTVTESRYRLSSTPLNFEIFISNPYNQTYEVKWYHIRNSQNTLIVGATGLSYSTSPFALGTIGSHLIRAQVEVGGKVVASHSFEVLISADPKPEIDQKEISPEDWSVQFSPLEGDQDFDLVINHNGATTTGLNYRTEWKLFRNGIELPSRAQVDNFPTGSAPSHAITYTFLVTDPNLQLGSYTLRARVRSDFETVDEHVWYISYKHPDLPKITSRNIYASGTSPAFNTTIQAFHDTVYTSSPTYNYIPCSSTTMACGPLVSQQANYCVNFANGEGAYTGDGKYIRVEFLLDGIDNIYTGRTSTGAAEQVCLSDGGAAVLNALKFVNTTSTSTLTHTIVARAIDEASNLEYSAGDMNAGLGTYPITWNLRVRPANEAPTVQFGPITGLTCDNAVGDLRDNCSVLSDTNFTVNIQLAGDDFYQLPADEARFTVSIRLLLGASVLGSCTSDGNGTDGYACTLSIPSYGNSGPINPTLNEYNIEATISDTGSPVAGLVPATSRVLRWRFPAGNVTEKNTPPVPAITTVTALLDEGSTFTLVANVTDAERDSFNWEVQHCLNASCLIDADYQVMTSGSVTRTDGNNPYVLTVNYQVPQDFVQRFTALNCDRLLRNGSCPIQVRLRVTDTPSYVVGLPGTSGLASTTIRNKNDEPVLATASANPNPATFTAFNWVTVGMPLTISLPLGFSTDPSPSSVPSEKNPRFQWYAKRAALADWEVIPGASARNLVWTPSLLNTVLVDRTVQLMVCVADYPEVAVGTPNPTTAGASVCNTGTPWTIVVNNNLEIIHDMGATSGTELAGSASDPGREMAVWSEIPTTFDLGTPADPSDDVTSAATYVAMIGNDKRIHVKKVLVTNTGEIDPIDSDLIVSFNPLEGILTPDAGIDSVKDLSIVGYQVAGAPATDLYIAYAVRPSGSLEHFAQVRRLNLGQSSAQRKTAPNRHQGVFGFDYDGMGFTGNCGADCNADATGAVTSIQLTSTTMTGDFTLTFSSGSFQFFFGAYNGMNTICDNCALATRAGQLATIINASTDPALAGIAAVVNGTNVDIYSSRANDYFNAFGNASVSLTQNVKQLGKIYVQGSTWYLPFLNSSRGGAENNMLSIYSKAVGQLNNTVNLSHLNVVPAALKFDMAVERTNLWIAVITDAGGNRGQLYQLGASSFAATGTAQTVFDGEVMSDIQIAASNSNLFVSGTLFSTGKIHIGIYGIDGPKTILEEFRMDDTSFSVDTTANFFNPINLSHFRLVPYGDELRIIGSSNYSGTERIYAARVWQTLPDDWNISCGACAPISSLATAASRYSKLAVSSVRSKIAPLENYRFSSDGSNSSEGIKDVVFFSFANQVGTSADPVLGVLNLESESIGTTGIFTGTSPNQDGGLFRPPLVKN